MPKKKTKQEPRTPREFTFKINKNCPHKDPTCGLDLECLACSYDYLVEKGDLVEADLMYIQFEKYLTGVKRNSVEVDQFRRKVTTPPTSTQLQLIKMLTRGEVPEVITKEQAEEIIRSLRKGK